MPVSPNHLRTIPDVGPAIFEAGGGTVTGCEPGNGNGGAGNLILSVDYLQSSYNGGFNDGNLLFNETGNTISFVPSASTGGADGSLTTTACPMVSIDGEVGYVASIDSETFASPTIAKFDLATQTRVAETTTQFDPSQDKMYRLLCVRRTDNHLFFIRLTIDDPSASAPGILYHLDENLNLVGSYTETGTETPYGYGAMQPFRESFGAPACAIACGVSRLYLPTEPQNDGVLVFDISGNNPTFLRYVVGPTADTTGIPLWDSLTTYNTGNKVRPTEAPQEIYQSVADGNLNHDPALNEAFWAATGPTLGNPDWDSGTTYASGTQVTYNGINWISLKDANLNHIPSNAGIWWQQIGADDYAIVDVEQSAHSVVCDCNDNAYVFVFFGNMGDANPYNNHGALLKIGPNDSTFMNITPANWLGNSVYLWDLNWGTERYINCFTYDLGNKILIIGGIMTNQPQYRIAAYNTATTPITELWHIDSVNSLWGEFSSVVTDSQLKYLDWTDGQTRPSSAAVIKTINTITGEVISNFSVPGMANWTGGSSPAPWYHNYCIGGWAVQSRN